MADSTKDPSEDTSAAAPTKKPASKTGAAKTAAADKPAKAKSSTAKSAGTASKAKTESSAEKPSTSAAKATAPKSSASKSSASKASATKGSSTTEGAGGTLKLHHLRPAPGAKTAKTRVGRGEASKGKTAGRGTKGTKARYQVPERFEGGQMPLHMRLPKLRGFRNPFRVEYQVVNLDSLASLYPQGGDVTVDDLVAKGAVRKGSPVKVLGSGDVSVKLNVQVQAVSASAKEKILAAGGSVDQD
ncbi:50S ribosomal protein L15 [Actinotalea sp. C106]|uniref:50S ribosomal protein L15 n=1 Tax=Actinotalea sp. C106 TaxID=2908644 RepID=UPI002029303D|nr:50S ribosomal protein L15 [Actinotalea sp. C106]